VSTNIAILNITIGPYRAIHLIINHQWKAPKSQSYENFIKGKLISKEKGNRYILNQFTI